MEKDNYTKFLAGLIASTALFFSGCGNSENFVFTNTGPSVIPVNNAPVAVDDSFAALGNATVNQIAANGVLTNDTLNGGTISSFDSVGSQGGAIVLNADGSFSYTPVFGFVGAETFTYTLSNADGDSTATVTMTSTGRGFFVDNTAPDGGDGSQASPFDTLSEATAASASGDTVFVARGNGTSTGLSGAVTLKDGVNLIGEGSGLVLAQTIVAPGQAPLLTGPINCGGNNTVSGIDLQGSTADSIVINGVGNVTIDNTSSGDPTEQHIDIDNATGSVTVSDCVFGDLTVGGLDYVGIDQDSVGANFVFTNNSFTNSSGNNPGNAVDFQATGTSADFTMVYSGNTVTSVDTTDDFDNALEVDSDQDGGSFALTSDNNVITRADLNGMNIDSIQDNVSLSGSITNNMISDIGDQAGLDLDGNNGTWTITGNIIDNCADYCIGLFSNGMGGTYIVENNQLSNAVNGITVADSNGGDIFVAVRGNTIQNASVYSMTFVQGNPFDFCAVITNNTVSDDLNFSNFGSNSFDVEQFGNAMGDGLAAINTLNGASINIGANPVNSVAQGACALP